MQVDQLPFHYPPHHYKGFFNIIKRYIYMYIYMPLQLSCTSVYDKIHVSVQLMYYIHTYILVGPNLNDDWSSIGGLVTLTICLKVKLFSIQAKVGSPLALNYRDRYRDGEKNSTRHSRLGVSLRNKYLTMPDGYRFDSSVLKEKC